MSEQTAHILVTGAASLDTKGHARKALQSGSSVPGEITVSIGGVARNVAENLAPLGQSTILLSAGGRDLFGAQSLERTTSADRCSIPSEADMSDRPVLERGRMYSPDEVAAILGVHVTTVRRWIHGGLLPAKRLGKRLFVYGGDLLPGSASKTTPGEDLADHA